MKGNVPKEGKGKEERGHKEKSLVSLASCEEGGKKERVTEGRKRDSSKKDCLTSGISHRGNPKEGRSTRGTSRV